MTGAKLAFFSSLCLGTFGLGCWQTRRYVEKVALVEAQAAAITDPTHKTGDPSIDNRIVLKSRLSGRFRHEDECLVGPRGPPPGALASDGPNSGRSGGGMSSSPQGYYVITPFVTGAGASSSEVLVNRGWVPKSATSWSRPSSRVSLEAVSSRFESGGMFSPPPVVAVAPKSAQGGGGGGGGSILLWMQEEALAKATKVDGRRGEPTEIFKEISPSLPNFHEPSSFPAKPTYAAAVEFKVTPETHAGYAFTWFSLSAAGLIMTRNLVKAVK